MVRLELENSVCTRTCRTWAKLSYQQDCRREQTLGGVVEEAVLPVAGGVLALGEDDGLGCDLRVPFRFGSEGYILLIL